MKDFFISYTGKDLNWAKWIGKILEENHYSVVFQAKDFRPGCNFVYEMYQAAEAAQTLALFSPEYFASVFTMPEWGAAFRLDPTGVKRKLIPIKIRPCELPAMLGAISHVDLVGKSPEVCTQLILEAVAKDNPFSYEGVQFPGHEEIFKSTSGQPKKELQAIRKLLEILDTAWVTFQAQARLKDQLVEKIQNRIPTAKHLQYEDFFHEYFDQMSKDELILHHTIRSYTSEVLKEYNQSALLLIKENPELTSLIPRIQELKSHLEIWLAKFKGIFTLTPSSCLIYVGVEEKKGFPKGIENELRAFLETHH